ncbi:hypothetical protein [Nostoc sp.]
MMQLLGVCWRSIVLASVKNSLSIAILAIGGGICYVLFAIFLGQPPILFR